MLYGDFCFAAACLHHQVEGIDNSLRFVAINLLARLQILENVGADVGEVGKVGGREHLLLA